MKTLRAHGFNQRPRTLSGTSRCPWTSRTARPPRSSQATSTWTILCSPARAPTPGPCSTRLCRQFPRKASALPQRPRRGLGADAPRRKPLRRRPCRRPGGRRADEQRSGAALHHGPSAQRGRRRSGGSGPCGRRSSRTHGGAGLPLPAPCA